MAMGNPQINLDRLAAQHAQKIIKKTSGDKPADVKYCHQSLGYIAREWYLCLLPLSIGKKEKEDV